MNEFENDDHIVEITDLDPIEKPTHYSRMFDALEKHPSLRKRFLRYFTAFCSVLLIMLVIFGTFPPLRGLVPKFLARVEPIKEAALVATTPTPADSFAFNAKDQVVWSLGDSSPFIPSATLSPAPHDCPSITQTHPFEHRGSPPVAGSSPVLVIGFGGLKAVLTNFKHAQPPEIGWYKRIFFLTETNYAGTVTFRGGEIHDGTPIWFGMKQHNQGPIITFTIHPLNTAISNHTGSDEEWGLSAATMYIARAGCYFLMATWPKGGWIVYFSAGK